MKFRQINKEYTGPNHTQYQTNSDEYLYTIVKNGAKPARGEYKWIVKVHPVSFIGEIAVPAREQPFYTQGFDTKKECITYANAWEASESYSTDRRNREAVDAVYGL